MKKVMLIVSASIKDHFASAKSIDKFRYWPKIIAITIAILGQITYT